MVGRPRQFDPDHALEAAMRAFWAKGYEATSLADLMAATGLHKGSLYQAFGDKHSLFLQSLRRYLEEMRQKMQEVHGNAASPAEALRALAHSAVDRIDGDCDCPMGCLAINSLVEMAPHDSEVRELLMNYMQVMSGMMASTVAAAQEAGQISRKHSPETITSLMTTFLAGIGAEVKGPMSKEQAHQLLDVQFDALMEPAAGEAG